MSFHFMFFRGGLIEKEVTVEGVWLTTTWGASTWLVVVSDVLLVLLNIWICLAEVWRLKSAVKHFGGCREWAKEAPWSAWNVVEGLTIVWMVVLVAGVLLLYKDITALTADVKDGKGAPELYEKTEDAIDRANWVKWFSVLYLIMTLARLFKGFSAQPRLGLVTNTIWRAGSDILHFLVVFVSVFVAFAVGGVMLFGSKVLVGCTEPGFSEIVCVHQSRSRLSFT